MRALRFHGAGDLRLETVPDPAAGPDQALVAVQACGVCGSDLHFLDGTARTDHVPITLGHEVAGRLVEPGPLALPAGARVAARAGLFCGECERCREGRSNLCRRSRVLGIDMDGGFAEQLALPAEMLIAIPEGVTSAEAATAVDAGATAFHAVIRSGAVTEGTSVLIIGIGGLGGYAVQFARRAGAELVLAADTDQDALERARSFGADEVIHVEPGTSLGRRVKMATGGGVDVALEFVGRAATVDAAIKSLRPGGRAVAAGVGNEPLMTIPPVLWSNNEYTLTGSYGSMPDDAATVLGLIADGSIAPIPTAPVDLDDAAALINALSRGESRVEGRPIVIPGGSQ